MDLGKQRTQEAVMSYIYKHLSRDTDESDTRPIPMSPRQREVARITSHYEGKVNATYHPPLSDQHQPTVKIDDTHFTVGRPDSVNKGDDLGGGRTKYEWQHEEFHFVLHLQREGSEITNTIVQIDYQPDEVPELLKTPTS